MIQIALESIRLLERCLVTHTKSWMLLVVSVRVVYDVCIDTPIACK